MTYIKKSGEKFDHILKQYRVDKGNQFTHTRIGDRQTEIYGGLYNIINLDDFYKQYYDHVFINGEREYLTERQLIENGPALIDIDLRYNTNIRQRQHDEGHIVDFIGLYACQISEIYDIPDNTKITVYVTQKNQVNCLDDITKDGIHFVFTIKMHKAVQVIIRKILLDELKTMWNGLPYINSMEELIDEAVVKGQVNWQLYGSQKPNNEKYRLTNCYTLTYNVQDDDWAIKSNLLNKFNNLEHFKLMSAQYTEHTEFPLKQEYCDRFEFEKKNLNTRDNKSRPKSNINIVNKEDLDKFDFSKIESEKKLDELIEQLFEDIRPIDYELKETHDFAMILPSSYYGESSYNKWIRVGWALKNTDEKLFLTWIKFSRKYENFSFADVPELYRKWKAFDINNPDKLTNRSIMYWAKIDNPIEYHKIRRETISFFVEQTVDKPTEFDLANVLYQIYKDKFVCVGIKGNIWYEYRNYRWNEIDSGSTLRLLISKKMHDIYMKKVQELVERILKLENSDTNTEVLRNRSNKLGEICVYLKTTNWKNNIMKEAKELFYDKNFINKLDGNPNLLCFNNYVVDFKNRSYRKGQPDDYISKSTNIDYIPLDKLKSDRDFKLMAEIERFIDELFPEKELRDYMWEHLASCLIGTNENQSFNIYTGSGCNGKSKLVDLMTKLLGDYKATVPITLITGNRNSVGSTSSEVVQLMGVRYAVMQEPTKGDKINEGIMKEITGGDPLQGRALYKDAVTFIPQFKLVVCTNTLFDVKSNDDGTWRRIRVCDFMSKFIDTPYEDLDKFPRENYPHQYKIDRKIDEKFDEWAPILASMLVNIVFRTNGRVKDCKQVLAVSDKYRESQDYLAEFAKEKIKKTIGKKIKKTEILEEFKNWYIMHYGRTSLPNGRDITDFMDKSYGKCNKGKWHNVEIIYEDLDDDDIY